MVPTTTPKAKVSNIARYGATIVKCEPTPSARQVAAETEAAALGDAMIIHPYDDPVVIAGQGTIGLELLDQLDHLDAVLVPVSGGGMLAGIATACAGTNTRVIAVEPEGKRLGEALGRGERSVFSAEHLRANPTLTTVADAMPTVLLGEAHAWPLVASGLIKPWDVLTVDDAAIESAVRLTASELKQAVEPAGAVALAGLLSEGFKVLRQGSCRGSLIPRGVPPLRRVACVMCGGNVDLETLGRILMA